MLDDDFFLTAPWTLADFVGPDGAQVLTGACTQRLLGLGLVGLRVVAASAQQSGAQLTSSLMVCPLCVQTHAGSTLPAKSS